LKFEGKSTEKVVSAYERKAACDDRDKAAARAEIQRLTAPSE